MTTTGSSAVAAQAKPVYPRPKKRVSRPPKKSPKKGS